KRRIELAEARSCFLGVRLPTSKDTACRQYTYCRDVFRRLLPHRPLRRCRSLVIPTGDEMGVSHHGLHVVFERIERTESHGPCAAFDAGLRLPAPDLHPTAQIPRDRKIRVERERLFDQGAALV